ncbi:MAG: GNAT family N-acetyltransferase [Acidimicrobiales bacterium]
MSEIEPPDPPLVGPQTALRPFRIGDAAAVAAACRDADIPRFTMMAEGLTEDQASAWIEAGLAWWPRGVARFAITVPPSDVCVGQIGMQLDLPLRLRAGRGAPGVGTGQGRPTRRRHVQPPGRRRRHARSVPPQLGRRVTITR